MLQDGLVNIIFATVVYFALQACVGNNVSTEINSLSAGYAAENAGIQLGDTIKKINGKTVRMQSDVNEILTNSNGEELSIVIKDKNGNEKYFDVVPTNVEYYSTGIYLTSTNNTVIAGFDSSSSVENQGLETGDKIISIDGTNVEDSSQKISEALENYDGNGTLEFTVKRDGKFVELEVTPLKRSKYMLGVGFKRAESNFVNNCYYAFFETADFSFSIVDNIKMMVAGKVSTDDLMGPIGISSVVAKTSGFADFIYILALISLSLGATNLLPFPPLDGGKIVLLIVEAIRKKPLDEKYEAGIQTIGFALLIGLSLFVTYKDIFKLF